MGNFPKTALYCYVAPGKAGRYRFFICRDADGTDIVLMSPAKGLKTRAEAQAICTELAGSNVMWISPKSNYQDD